MTKAQKWDKFLFHLRTKPATQQELAAIFDVTDRTVRRWLLELEENFSESGVALTKYADPDTNEYIYGLYEKLPRQKRKPSVHTYRIADDDSPYIIAMIPDKIFGEHPDYGKYIKLTPIADVHYGHRSCCVDKFKMIVNKIEREPHHFTFFGADITENSSRFSVGGGVYEQIVPPQQQKDEVTELLRPIAHKAFFGSSGNHGYRSWKAIGLDPDLDICNSFDIPYFTGQYHFDINWRGQTFSIVGYHGVSKGGSPKSKLNALVQTAKINEVAHIHCMFHLHTRMSYQFITPIRNKRTCKLDRFVSRAVLFGGFLKYWGEYMDQNAMDQAMIGTYSVILCEDGKVRLYEEDFED